MRRRVTCAEKKRTPVMRAFPGRLVRETLPIDRWRGRIGPRKRRFEQITPRAANCDARVVREPATTDTAARRETVFSSRHSRLDTNFTELGFPE
jgi:hypothetical protein